MSILRARLSRIATPLGLILLFAFLLRVVGIGYGLPLTVVADETPFTFAALKMLQLKTLVPALHPEAFQAILPYPPYLSYMLLLPFTLILSVQYLLWSAPLETTSLMGQGSAELFQAHLVSDLSAFFLTARLVNVVFGTLSVFLVYRIAQTLFRSRIAAITASFLLATSILHIALSMTGRNWIPVSFVFLLIFYVLTRQWTLQRRHLLTFAIAGIAMGISSLSAFFCVFIILHYVLFDARSFKNVMSDLPRMVFGALIFVGLAIIPSFLYRSGNAFLGAITLFEQKSLGEFFLSPWSALSLVAYSEPVLSGAFVLGLGMLSFSYRRLSALFALWTLFYIAVFYFLFRFDARFLLPLLPLFALAGGYAIAQMWNQRTKIFILIMLMLPLGVALPVSFLSMQGDTRDHARSWVLEHLTAEDKILVFSSAMHIPTQKAAVAELRAIDATTIRSINEADEVIDRIDAPYALNNLTSITNKEFIKDLPRHAKQHQYAYVLLEPRSLVMFPEMAEAFAVITKDAEIVQEFKGLGDSTSIFNSAFLEPFPVLFSGKSFGPDILIYRLSQ